MRRSIPAILSLIVASAAYAQEASSPLLPVSLSAEHAANPVGIGAAAPRLSWKLTTVNNVNGAAQTAYEIRASGSFTAAGGKIELAQPYLIDTGKIASDQSILVPWPGKPLNSRDAAAWQVRVWDKDGKVSAWSEPATVEMGLLHPQTEWKGQWITVDLPRVDIVKNALARAQWINAGSTANQLAAARTVVNVPPGVQVKSATFDAAANGLITLYVNGKSTHPGSSSHTGPFHTTFANELVPGKNVIGVASAAVRGGGRGPGGGRNALAAHISIELSNGNTLELNTDPSWKAAAAPAEANWFDPAFDDASWAAATALGPYDDAPATGPADATVGPGRYFRKSFALKGPVAKARLYATALGTYEMSINGKPVSSDQLSPGWTDYNKRVMVQTYDVTPLLAPGQNALGAVLTDGWFAGRVGWMGLAQYSRISTHPLLNAQLEITYRDGSTEIIPTDASWKGSSGEIVGSDQQLGEILDGRMAAAYDQPSFDDSAWHAAAAEQHEGISLDPQVGPPVRRLAELSPRKISRVNGSFIVDFGQNMVGHIRLRAQGPAGTTINVRHAEMVNPDGTLYTENLRPALSLDTFILGDHPQTFEPHFTFHGFRYAEISGLPDDVNLSADDLRAIVVGSDTPQVGTFECSNAEVNRFFENILWGQRSNFISVPTDCPQRDERMGWMGDAQCFAPTATMNADVSGFFQKWMIDVNDAQGPQGEFNNVCPRANQNQSYPVWGDAGVIIPWVMYTHYGDKAFLSSNYDHMAKWVDYEKERYPDLLPFGGVGDHLAPVGGRGGTPPGTGGAGAARGRAASGPAVAGGRGASRGAGRGFGAGPNTTSVVDAAYFAHSAEIVSKSAALLGKTEEAAKYDQLRKEIIAAFNKAYVQPDGSMTAGTQTTYLLALQFNLVPEDLRPAIAKHLTDDIEQRGHLTTGFVGVGHLEPGLCAIGRSDLAYQLLLTETYPSWLFTVKQGATTIWERWDGYTPERGFQDSSMNSFNHYSLGSVGLWFYSGAAGIQLDENSPGYKHFILNPQLTTKLSFVKSSFDSPYGPIRSYWHAEGNTIEYDATVPPNTTATLKLPGETRELTAGTYKFTVPLSAVK